MAHHQSAKKRARQTPKRSARNTSIRSRVKTGVKRFRIAAEAGDAEQTSAAFRSAEGLLRRAASQGVIPKQRAARHISRLAKLANRVAANRD